MDGNKKIFYIKEPALRLDRFLADILRPEGISREKIKQLIQRGYVHINDSPCKSPKEVLKPGQTVCIVVPDTQNVLLPDPGELNIVYEDEYCLIVNKPYGVTVHPCPSCPDGTMVNRLLFHFPKLRNMDGTRPGIVHRLDKDTSGLLLVALDEKTRIALAAAFSARVVKKEYLALIKGVPNQKEADITVPVGRHPTYKTKMAAFPGCEKKLPGSVRTAHSHYRVLFADPNGRFSLVLVSIHTGRTHQIRVHMAHIGHPLWGDPLYGGPTHLAMDGSCLRFMPEEQDTINQENIEMDDTEFLHSNPFIHHNTASEGTQTENSTKTSFIRASQQKTEKKTFANVPQGAQLVAERQMLHAFHLSFNHPETGNLLDFYSKIPSDFKTAMLKLLSRPLRVIITGLPGCGKSALTHEMEQLGLPVWSADACVRTLYEPGNDGWMLLRRRFGNKFIKTESSSVDKAELFAAMCTDPSLRKEIEELIHPLVEYDLNTFWTSAEKKAALSGHIPISVAEIPLFLEAESGARMKKYPESPYPDPIRICVFCPDRERHARLEKFRHVPTHIAATLDSWQWDITRKVRACHILIDNSGSREAMAQRAYHLLGILKTLQKKRTCNLVAKALATIPSKEKTGEAFTSPSMHII